MWHTKTCTKLVFPIFILPHNQYPVLYFKMLFTVQNYHRNNIQISKMSKGTRCVGLGISSAASASELESTFAQPLTFLPTHQLTTIVFVIKHKTNIKHKRSAENAVFSQKKIQLVVNVFAVAIAIVSTGHQIPGKRWTIQRNEEPNKEMVSGQQDFGTA